MSDQLFQISFCFFDCGCDCVKARFVLLPVQSVMLIICSLSHSVCDQFFEHRVRGTLPVTHELNYS